MNNLKKIRGKLCISTSEMCKKLGISRQHLWNVENKKITLSLALKASKTLNVNVFEILGDEALIKKPTTEEEKEILIKIIQG